MRGCAISTQLVCWCYAPGLYLFGRWVNYTGRGLVSDCGLGVPAPLVAAASGSMLTFNFKWHIISYMKRDSRLSSVLHALLHMAEHEGPVTSDSLAQCLGTNPVVVRRTLAYLRKAGIVTSDRGHAGGWRILADLGAVTLRQLHEALGEPAMFAMANRNETPQCLVEQSVNAALAGAFAEAEALLLQRFSEITLADLAADFARRHAAAHHNRH